MNEQAGREKWGWQAAMWIAVLTYTVLFTFLSWLKFQSFHTASLDFVFYLRKLWGLRNWDFTNPLLEGEYIWSDHLEPAVMALSQLGRWIPAPQLLYFTQSAAIALTAWIIFRFARHEIGTAFAFGLAFCFLLQPAVQNANLADFHMVTLALPVMALFLEGVLLRRPQQATIALLVGLTLREEVAGVLFLWGFVRARTERRSGVLLVFLSLAWVGMAFFLKQSGPSEKYFLDQIVSFGSSVWGGAVLAQKGESLFWLLAGFAFFSLRSPRILVWALFPFLFFCLTSHPPLYRMDFYYLSLFTPFLAFAAVQGIQKLGTRARIPALVAVGFCSLATLVWNTHAPWGRQNSAGLYRDDSYSSEARKVCEGVSPNESVSAPFRIGAHLAARKWIFGPFLAGPDHVILELKPHITLGETPAQHAELYKKIEFMVHDLQNRFHYEMAFQGKWLCHLKLPKHP